MKKYLILLLAIPLFFVSCVEKPSTFSYSQAKITYRIVDNQEIYTFLFHGEIENQYSNVVLQDIKGQVLFFNNLQNSKVPVLVEKFSIKEIFPYNVAAVDIKKECSEDEIKPYLSLLRLQGNLEEVRATGSSQAYYLNERATKIKVSSMAKTNISAVLKERQK